MKKTLLATAIAGALGASAAAQAATVYNQDGTQLDIYGNIQIAYSNVETAQYDETGARTGTDSDDQIQDNGSTVGFAGQHAINSGLTGYFKAEFEHNADEEKSSGGLNRGDQAYLGLQGNFGDVRLGSWDPLIDDWIQDPISNNEYFDVTDSNTLISGADGVNTQRGGSSEREGDKIQYLSPSFNGLQFAVGSQYKGSGEGGYDDDGVLGGENVDNSGNASFFGGAKYTMGAFSVAAVYDNLANYDGDVTGSTYLDEENGVVVETTEEFDAGDQFGVTFEYTLAALNLAAKYERYESGDGELFADQNRYGLGARYGYGFGDVYGAYQYVDVGGSDFGDTFSDLANDADLPSDTSDESYNEVIIGATYNITSSFFTFAEAAFYDREDDEDDGFAVGAVYAF